MEFIIKILKKILSEQDMKVKYKLICEFQNFVLKDDDLVKHQYFTDLETLSFDFDFYTMDPDYYGEQKMRNNINELLDKIQNKQS